MLAVLLGISFYCLLVVILGLLFIVVLKWVVCGCVGFLVFVYFGGLLCLLLVIVLSLCCILG